MCMAQLQTMQPCPQIRSGLGRPQFEGLDSPELLEGKGQVRSDRGAGHLSGGVNRLSHACCVSNEWDTCFLSTGGINQSNNVTSARICECRTSLSTWAPASTAAYQLPWVKEARGRATTPKQTISAVFAAAIKTRLNIPRCHHNSIMWTYAVSV